MKGKKLLGLILLIISIIVLIGLGVAIGFYKQILAIGFDPLTLFLFVGLITFCGIMVSSAFLIDVENL